LIFLNTLKIISTEWAEQQELDAPENLLPSPHSFLSFHFEKKDKKKEHNTAEFKISTFNSTKAAAITTHTHKRYDVELLQRIEELIGKKMDQFPYEEEEVMVLVDRVTEAQRFAVMVVSLSSFLPLLIYIYLFIYLFIYLIIYSFIYFQSSLVHLNNQNQKN